MDVLREREVKDSLERQLLDEQKIRGKQDPCSFFVLLKWRDNIVLDGLILFPPKGIVRLLKVPLRCSGEYY